MFNFIFIYTVLATSYLLGVSSNDCAPCNDRWAAYPLILKADGMSIADGDIVSGTFFKGPYSVEFVEVSTSDASKSFDSLCKKYGKSNKLRPTKIKNIFTLDSSNSIWKSTCKHCTGSFIINATSAESEKQSSGKGLGCSKSDGRYDCDNGFGRLANKTKSHEFKACVEISSEGIKYPAPPEKK